MPDLVVTWARLYPGDLIRGADADRWLVTALAPDRKRTHVELINRDGVTRAADVRSDSVVTVLRKGAVRECVEILTADTGWSAELIKENAA